MQNRIKIKYLISFLVVVGISYFFVREFYRNYDSLSKFEFNIKWIYLLAAQFLLILLSLVGTYSWKLLLAIITPDKSISFIESVAIVNTTQLTKYLPGKVWSYAFQMLWLSKKGFSKTIVLYANLFLMLSSLFASSFLGLLYFACFSHSNKKLWLLLFLAFLIGYLGFIIFNQYCLKIVIKIAQKLFKKTINYTHINVGWVIMFQFVYLLANAIFGITGYFLALGLGFSFGFNDIFAISASLIISDMIGFIILIAPGGLGVREGIMFTLLEVLGNKNLSIILPIGTRIIGMISDVILGGIGFYIIKNRKLFR